MPTIDFAPELKKPGDMDFDRLKLKKDEKARIVCLEKPTFAWTHTLRAPKIVDGVPIKITKKRNNGDEFIDYDLEFIGRPLCLGDYGLIADKGVDPANCPICQHSTMSDEVGPPERRFAMNVIRYGLTRDNQLVTPFACSCVVWAYTEGIYTKLVDIGQEHGGIVGRDLVLGPCTVEMYQKYDILPAGKNVWQVDPAIGEVVKATFSANRLEDLERACGRRTERRWMDQDLASTVARWRAARGPGASDGTEVVERASLTEELTDLFAATATPLVTTTAPVTTSAASAPPATQGAVTSNGLDFSDLLGAPTLPTGTVASSPTKADPPSAVDFDSLLKSLS